MIDAEGRREWRENWPVVASAMAGLIVAHVHLFSMGVMIGPLETEFGWSRAEITSGLFIIALVLFPLSPVVGVAIDRFGPRSIAIWGAVVYCVAVASLSLAQPMIWTWWALWAFVAFGALFLTPTVWVSAIASLFFASRGLALSVTLSATGLISFSGPIITYFLVEHFGWRAGYVLWAAIGAIISLPMLLMFFRSAGVKASHVRAGVAGSDQPVGRSLFFQGIRSTFFLRLVTAGPLMAVVFTAVSVNIVPVLMYSGISKASAAAIAGVIGISQTTGRLASGYFIDRLNARHVGAVVVIFPIVASILLIMFAGYPTVAVLALLTFGLAVGAELDVLAYLASRFFKPGNFGSIFGVIMGCCSLGAGIGPTLGNLSFDLFGSYYPLLWAIIPICILVSVCFASLPPYPDSK